MLYSYDGAGNRLSEVWKDAQNLTVESFNYNYNPGNYLENKGSSSFISWLDNEWRTVSLWSGNDSIYGIRQEWIIPPPNPPIETITRQVAVNGQYLAKLVGSPIAMQSFFHHTDIVGTVRAVTDINGAVVVRYAYEPFGSLTTASGLVDGELHRFTGKPSDLETDLSYFNARYYDSALGRFTSSDPARDGLNWYQYCNGNPIVNMDQNGEAVTNVVGLVVGAGGGALLGIMLSDHYGLIGLKRAATIAGCSVGGAAIGWFAGPVVDRIANEIAVKLSIIPAPSGLMMGEIKNALRIVEPERIHHIVDNLDYCWDLVGCYDWVSIQEVIRHTLISGEEVA